MILASHGIIASSISQGVVPLLDIYGSAAAAYSLRKLRSAYTGSAIRVRRTDLTESDIGFDANGNLDTTALLAFTGTGALDNGFVTTWYDQSGNGKNATQTTGLSQPQIVSSGVIVRTSGNILAIDCNGKQMSNTQTNTLTQATFNAQEVSSTGSDNVFSLPFGTINTSGYFSVASNGSTSLPYQNVGTPIYFVNNNSITATRDSVFDNTATNNETLLSVIGGGSPTSNRFLQYVSPGLNGNYKVFEVVIYNSDQSSNRTGIETNINDFYSIY
jgi:hypothetical protein